MSYSRLVIALPVLLLGLGADLRAQTGPIVDCASSVLVTPQVELTWRDVPTEDSLISSPTAQLSVLVSNTGSAALDFQLVGRMHAGGHRVSLGLANGSLPAGGAQTVQLALDSFGIDISSLEFSGSLFIEAQAHRSGVLVDRAYSPTRYFHQDPGSPGGPPTTHIYGNGARRLHFHSGDLTQQIFTGPVPAAIQGISAGGRGRGFTGEDRGPGPGGGTLKIAQPQQLNPGEWEFCMRWVYQSVDSGFGEDHYKSGYLMKARGMKVLVDHPNWAQPMLFNANDDNGCFSFESQENSGFVLTIFAEAQLGGAITVRTYDTVAQANDNDPDEVAQWVVQANPGGAPRRVYYQNEASAESSLMALGSFVLHWVDSHTEPGLAGTLRLSLVTDGAGCDGSCQPGNQARLQAGAEQRKFLIGHEVGHWIHRKWGNGFGVFENAYDENAGGAACTFDGVGSHAMRSRETAGGSFLEGFAHFLAALAWNDHGQKDGWFKYYKEIDAANYADMEADNWRVDIEADGLDPIGGVSRWMHNMCTPIDGHSVEMDWLHFFWDYRTDGPPQVRPSHNDIFEHLLYWRQNHHPTDNLDTYDKLLEAIQDIGLGQTLFQDRWSQLAVMNGVAQ